MKHRGEGSDTRQALQHGKESFLSAFRAFSTCDVHKLQQDDEADWRDQK